MREIVFDTETTGLSFDAGHRLAEIGCVELVNRVETGRTFHAYLNPERPMPAEAQRIHGLSDAFLSDKPVFASVVHDFLAFIGDDPLVAHNASFDFGFLNGELTQAGLVPVAMDRMVDTLAIARVKHPGSKHSLDALCTRYGIDRSLRTFHGALLDAQLLAQVYVELTGGRQIDLVLRTEEAESAAPAAAIRHAEVRPPRIFDVPAHELDRHASFVADLKDPLWTKGASG